MIEDDEEELQEEDDEEDEEYVFEEPDLDNEDKMNYYSDQRVKADYDRFLSWLYK